MNSAPAREYERRSNLHLVRNAERRTFTCSRCGGQKMSKLVAHRVAEPAKPLCNGCYGFLLSRSRHP
jgi:transcription elongation factor Elf1